MKRLVNILILVISLLQLPGCHEQPDWKNDPYGNFDALWTILDEHYCFFAYKNVDWQEVRNRYRSKIHKDITTHELFDLCSDMLKELQDGHTNLISSFDVSRYWIWEKYPINYDERLIDEHYLHFDYRKASGIKYQILSNHFAYMYYGDFSTGIGDGNLDVILNDIAPSDGLIIDVRNNGGGYLTNVETLVARFIDQRIYAGSIQHKNGTGHNDFSEPFDYHIDPAKGRVHYNKPIVVLTNRGSFSATNNFVSIMKSLPNVTVVGDVTGGGCGLPFNSELPNGWSVRFSAAPITGPDGKLTEFGVEPDVKVDMAPNDISNGHDTILDYAFEILKQAK